ncbi:MAG: aldose 1-epimerase family protein, partial [Chloroflexi bacterium]|nr:aldose 1-epimerase family protein [Chloroflexota bacterium]
MVAAYGRDFDRSGLARHAGDLSALGGVRSVILQDGAERGIRALEFRTGSGLAFDVLVDRAMDIGPAEHAGRSFGWRSATGFRHPGLHEYSDERGLSWLRSFSGLIATAGLDHTLFTAEVDASQYHYPYRKTVWNGLHGRVANIPARLTGYGEEWATSDRCILWAEGEIRQAAVFAEHLRLRRRIEADLGGNSIRLIDTVTNHGFDPTPHMFLYHINLGWPLVDEGSRFVAPISRIRMATDAVRQQRISYQTLPPPQSGFVEQVYAHDVVADSNGHLAAAVVNDRLHMAVQLEWNAGEFPYFFEWLHLHEGAYAVGLEPSTHDVGGDTAARQSGSMIWLQ